MTTAIRTAIFIGDSLIEYFDWQARFPSLSVHNLGRAGETASELLARLTTLDANALAPDWVIIMSGTNDLLMNSDFLPSYKRIITQLQTLFPNASLLANGLMPMPLPWLKPHLIPQTNARLEELALRHKIRYLDGCQLLGDSNASRPYFLDDGVHLSPQGYALWSAAIETQLHLAGYI